MSPQTTPVTDLVFLDQLMTSDDVWVQAAEEGRLVARHVIDSAARTLVLYGPARGSTDFLRRWVLPELERSARVVFHERGTVPSPSDAAADIDVWDGFETCITDSAGPSRTLLEYVARQSAAAAPQKTVLILQEDYLNRLFQLRRTVPGILDDLFEIPPMPAARFIDAVHRTVSRFGVGIDDACRAAVARDLDAVRTVGPLGPELVAILAFEIVRVTPADPVFTTTEYNALGGLRGLLGRHIDFLLEHVPGGHEAIGWAVLQRAARTPVDVVTDLTDIAHRFDVPIDVPQQVLAWLEHDRRVLSANTGGGHDIVPGLLRLAVASYSARIDELTENVRSLLRQGVRQFAESGGLLTDQQFRRINEQRSALMTTEDEATLMLRCALGHSEAGNPQEIEHWLRRVRSETAKIEILVDMLFDIRPELRARAATCLRQFDAPDVRAQLHLVALREADDAVRAAAVDSLGVLGTPEIRSDLIRETSDPDSPFQLQAIEALRVFPDPPAVDALVRIVSGSGPGHGPQARARAISALGALDTEASRLALVRIAIEDPDDDDRRVAVAAIGGVRSEASAAHVLDLLSAPVAPARGEPRRRSFWEGAAESTRLGLKAVAVATANLAVHGLLLMTIGERRQGIIITLAEITILTLAFAVPGMEVFWLLSLVTLLIGYLSPTRLLLRRRTDGVKMTPYQRALGRTLFIFGCAMGFLAVHGLPSMLTRHVRRGVMLTAFEFAGLALMILSRTWYADLGLEQAALRDVFWRTHLASWILFSLGAAVFATTYVLGIRTAASDLFTSSARRAESERRDTAYLGVLPNSHAIAAVVNDLRSPDPARAEVAIALCARYTRILRPALRTRWTDADEGLKSRITSMIMRQPDQASVELLQSVATTRKERRRAARAMWKLRLAIWPPVARAAVLLGLATLVAYVFMLRDVRAKSTPLLLAEAQKGNTADAVRAIRTLGTLAQARPSPAEHTLEAVLESPSTNTAMKQAAIDALRSFGTAEATDVLRHFIERPSGEDPNKLKETAIRALGRIQSVWALSALRELSQSQALSRELVGMVDDVAGKINPLALSEYYLERGQFEAAIENAKFAMKAAPDRESAAKAAAALANVYALRGLGAYEREDYDAAMADLTSALASGATAANLGSAIGLAQQLGYRSHETVALRDPKAYQTAYRAYKSIEPYNGQFGEAFAIEADANLAESALTSRRPEEALRLARHVAQRAAYSPDFTGKIVPMWIVEAAALAVQGHETQAKKALQTMRGQKTASSPTWRYDGLKNYLDTAPMSDDMRNMLLAEIRRVSTPDGAPR